MRTEILFAAAAGFLLLLLSGTVRGEAGRIWIPLMPLFLLAATAVSPPEEAARTEPTTSQALLLGGLLISLCFAIRISWQVP